MARRDLHAGDVFINCPFDAAYRGLFEAVVFTVFDCGFSPRCALEIDDAAEVRIHKLMRIIEQSRLGIHDLSRTESDTRSGLPRFNMPLELGLFLSAKRFGNRKQKRKRCVVLDSTPYRYQAFISDIAGQDVRAHGGSDRGAIRSVRDWLGNHSGRRTIPSGSLIHRRYRTFRRELPGLCREVSLDRRELTYKDYCAIVSRWLALSRGLRHRAPSRSSPRTPSSAARRRAGRPPGRS